MHAGQTGVRLGAIGLFACAIGCTETTPRADGATSDDSSRVAPPAEVAHLAADRGVVLATGPILLLPDPDGSSLFAVVIRPDATGETVADTSGVSGHLVDRRIEFFSRAGRSGDMELSGELRPGNAAAECPAWPVTRLSPSAGFPATWTVAVPAGRISAVPLDSIEGAIPRDSALWAATLTALASRLPDDTSRTFRARPYVVEHAWRTITSRSPSAATPSGVVGTDPSVIIATLVRRTNQEDAPREERVLLLVDAPTTNPSSWRVGWHERAEGDEDALEVAEPLLAFTPHDGGAIQLLFGRDDGDRLHATLLARQGGEWRLVWESARASCR